MRNSVFLCALAILATAGCGKKKSGGTVSLNVLANSTSTNLENALSVPALADIISPFSTVGANTTTQLQSLKYVFGFMSICESVTTNGSAFSNTSNCIQIYTGPTVGDGTSSAITPENLSTYASSQIDLMDATSRATLNQSVTLTSDNVRSYNYAVINWYTPIAVKGCATAGASLLCTKNTGATYASNVTTVTPTLVSTATTEAQEAIVVSANGGSFFRFQQPFTITDADIDAGTSFTVDMVFNPSGVLTANASSNADGNLRGSAGSMYVPMLNIAPVPRKGSQTTKRETYLATNCPSTTNSGPYRVELYYNSDNSSSILGATGGYVADSTSTGLSIGQADLGAKIIAINTEADGTLSLKTSATSGSEGTAWITGLTRGANGTLTMRLDSFGGTAASCAYTYVGTATVQ